MLITSSLDIIPCPIYEYSSPGISARSKRTFMIMRFHIAGLAGLSNIDPVYSFPSFYEEILLISTVISTTAFCLFCDRLHKNHGKFAVNLGAHTRSFLSSP